jgi:hypothetical protein
MTKEGTIMHQLFIRAANAMNYVFLRQVIDREDLTPILSEELSSMFEHLSLTPSAIPWDYYEICKTEMFEGDYLLDYTEEEFNEKLASTIKEIMGEVDKVVYEFYVQVASEARKLLD